MHISLARDIGAGRLVGGGGQSGHVRARSCSTPWTWTL